MDPVNPYLLWELPKLRAGDIVDQPHLRQLATEAVRAYTGGATYILDQREMLAVGYVLTDREVAATLNLLSNEARQAALKQRAKKKETSAV